MLVQEEIKVDHLLIMIISINLIILEKFKSGEVFIHNDCHS